MLEINCKIMTSKNIGELTLESRPVLTNKEIAKYNWLEHTFYLKKGFNLERKLAGKVPLDTEL